MKRWYARQLAILLVAATIWAGIFAVPYAFEQAWWRPSITMLVVVSGIIMITNLLLASVVLQSDAPSLDLVGIFQHHLPANAKHLASFITMWAFFVFMMVYCILAPQFLSIVFGWNEPNVLLALLYVTGIGLMLHKHLAEIQRFEHRIILLLTTLILGCSVLARYGWTDIPVFFDMSVWWHAYLPYGVLLFALNSMAAVPLICMLAPTQPRTIKHAIIWAGIFTALIVGVFAIAITWLTWSNTSPDTLNSLYIFLWPAALRVAAAIGVLAMISPHIIFGTHLRKTFMYDYRMPRWLAWILVTWWPFLLVLLLHPNLAEFLGWAGSIAAWWMALLILRVARRFWRHATDTQRQQFLLSKPNFFAQALILTYLAGMIITMVLAI